MAHLSWEATDFWLSRTSRMFSGRSDHDDDDDENGLVAVVAMAANGDEAENSHLKCVSTML